MNDLIPLNTSSYVYGAWLPSPDKGLSIHHSITGKRISFTSSVGVDFARTLEHGRKIGGPALRKMTVHERARALRMLAKHLLERKERLYGVSACTGATRSDSWLDIEGGVATLFGFSSIARRQFSDETFIVEGPPERLSRKNTFSARHILVPKRGVSVHINAFNFPCWGMLEKIAPSLIAGVPAVVKPATGSAYLAEAMAREIIASQILPEGALQVICGHAGDLLDHVEEQDVVTFTGSSATGQALRTHPNIVARSVPLNLEADSLNCCILGQSVDDDDPEFDLFIGEICRELTTKAGQRCTAIRRAIVPAEKLDIVVEALRTRLAKVTVGDPAIDGVQMGPLLGASQKAEVQAGVDRLARDCELVLGGTDEFPLTGDSAVRTAFYAPTLLVCSNPMKTAVPHSVEAFGPVSTVMPYRNVDEAVELAGLGKGSLVGSVFTHDNDEATAIVLGTAAWHGRMLVINRDCAAESTGHGSPLPKLVHGGPGRAGGGEELGGARAVKAYMQRTSVQGSPTTLMAITRQYLDGANTTHFDVHPFRKHFEDLLIGESLTTHRRTVTETDVVNFGCVSGDHFYAHFDDPAARDSLFGKRVAHGYFVVSAAAGLFVDPAPGPILANYGLENLRFIEPVGIGDTIHATITVKQKIKREKSPDDEKATGVVKWGVEVLNQNAASVARYDVLTLVERRVE